MNKTLFSLAFVAASGAYVVTAGHLFRPTGDTAIAMATDTALPATTPSPIKPTTSTLPLVISSQMVPSEIPQITAQAKSPQLTTRVKSPQIAASMTSPPVVAPVMETHTLVAQAMPTPVPPLPRPRPMPPTQVTVQPAASATVTATATSGTSGYADGTYRGADENAYYGRVQVQVTVANHQVSSVKVLDYPRDRRTSRYINSQALPMLKREVIAAQSANIDTVSGATLTSEAYIRSLGSALAQAAAAHA